MTGRACDWPGYAVLLCVVPFQWFALAALFRLPMSIDLAQLLVIDLFFPGVLSMIALWLAVNIIAAVRA